MEKTAKYNPDVGKVEVDSRVWKRNDADTANKGNSAGIPLPSSPKIGKSTLHK